MGRVVGDVGICVLPEHQKKGVGKLTMKALMGCVGKKKKLP